jgi:DNA-binding LytR/AlgR family response regulator
MTPGAVRASWKVAWWKSVLFSTAGGIFLGFVGAFGTATYAVLPRMLVFTFIGIGGGVIVAGAVWLSEIWPWLADRPIARRIAIALTVGLSFGVWVWLVISWLFLGGLQLEALLISVGYSLALTGPMTFLSWLVFRPRQASPASVRPAKFLERLPVRLRGAEVYAVEAEDHYLRIHTSQGSDLILMRLSDAIAELDGIEGAQTHRSWWVAKAALADATRGDGRAVLKLKDGTEAPVSRSYSKSLRDAGWY